MDYETFRDELKDLLKKALDNFTGSQIVRIFLDCLDEAFYEKAEEYYGREHDTEEIKD